MTVKRDSAETEEPANGSDRYRAPALDRGLDILEVLATQARGLTRTEIVRELDVSASQIYRMLERLVARGYVCRTEGGDRYALTMQLFLLATGHPPVRRLVAQAQPLMDDFAAALSQSCHLVLPEHARGVIVAQASPRAHWEFRARLGAEMDLFTTSSGLTLLAFQDPEHRTETLGLWGLAEAEAALAPITGDLAAIRATGYRMAPSGQAVGVTDISVPVLGPSGDAVAALTCPFIEHPDETRADQRDASLASLRDLGRTLSLSQVD